MAWNVLCGMYQKEGQQVASDGGREEKMKGFNKWSLWQFSLKQPNNEFGGSFDLLYEWAEPEFYVEIRKQLKPVVQQELKFAAVRETNKI